MTTRPAKINFAWMCKSPSYVLALGLGSGLSPWAPGTMGSLAAAIVYWFLLRDISLIYLGVIIVVGFVLGVYVSDKTGKALAIHDYSGIVWDEWIGMWLTMFAVPQSLTSCVIGFVLFRLFDIVKPFPISYADKHFKNGFGVMFDDVLAALFSQIVLQSLLYWRVLS